MTYSSLSKRFPKHSYFCGWYYRCQSNKQTLAIIPSVHKTKDSAFCTIQVITDTHAFHVQFPYDDWEEDDDQIRISNNRFGKSGFSLDIHTPEFHVAGSVHFGAFTPIKYDITEDLYNAYRSFCKDYNETPIDNIASFSRRLLRCYGDRLEKDKWRKNGEKTPQWGFKGILLQPMSEVKIYNV